MVTVSRPVLLAVDDDAEVLRAIERDLRKRYAERYRVLANSSGTEALKILEKLRKRNEPVALLLSDHRMPVMTGVEFLAQAMKQCPDARRVLLTAYADTDAAIRAINEIKLNHYLLKPWHPPTTYRIVRKHRGDIRVESQLGDTRFQVRLPVAASRPGS